VPCCCLRMQFVQRRMIDGLLGDGVEDERGCGVRKFAEQKGCVFFVGYTKAVFNNREKVGLKIKLHK